MRQFVFFIFLFLFISNSSFSQEQNNQWRFGFGGGLSFGNDGSVAFVEGQTLASEGSCAIANRNSGELLFYTDGLTVWNANEDIMLNGTGLLGGTPELMSSTAAAAIVRSPANENEYYIFTIDEQSSSNGLRYSMVDMNLDGGLGGIINGQKNIPVFNTTSEKLQIVPNAALNGYWIITHDNQEALVAFQLTAAGLSTTPVISNITSPQFNGAGHFKVNRTFDRLAMGSFFESNLSLYDFNNATGVFSNPVSWSYNFGTSLQYGVEFSPNGQVLYVSNLEKIVQYDISSNVQEAIENSGFEVFIGNFQTGNPATMQIARNDKIYVNNGGSIGVINCPDFLGTACNWEANALPGFSPGGYGLHIWSYDIAATNPEPVYALEADENCAATPIDFSFIIPTLFDEINILWGDGNASSTVNASVEHTYETPGTYTILVEVTNGCQFFNFDTLFVVEDCAPEVPNFILLGDICNINDDFILQIPFTSTVDQIAINYGLVGEVSESLNYEEVSGTFNQTLNIQVPGLYEFCVNYTIDGLLDTLICETIEIGLCCDYFLEKNANCIESESFFNLNATNSMASIVWQFQSPSGRVLEYNGVNVSALLDEIGEYIVTVAVEGECGDTTLINSVVLEQCEKVFCEPFVPNAFTPNNDGINEVFMPVFDCEDNDFVLRVFNRWGDKIYDSENTGRGWNGGLNGYYAQDGMYIYEVEFSASSVERKKLRGTFTLLR